MLERVHFSSYFIISLSVITTSILWSSCGKDQIEMFDCTGVTPTYTIDIKPILDASCAKSGCHDAQSHESGFDFSTHSEAKISSQAQNFLGAIQHASGFVPMPNDGPKLSSDKIKLLSCWVQNGSPE